MANVLYTTFGYLLPGLTAKGKPYAGNFGVLARNIETGNFYFAAIGRLPKRWGKRQKVDQYFFVDSRNDDLFLDEVVVERDIDLRETWPECWFHKHIERAENKLWKLHLFGEDTPERYDSTISIDTAQANR